MCPRFLQSKTVELNPVSDDLLLDGRSIFLFFSFIFCTNYFQSLANMKVPKSNDFRVQFTFDDFEFVSPWFRLRDPANGVSLIMLNIIFVFSGSRIVDVKWDADCRNPPSFFLFF